MAAPDLQAVRWACVGASAPGVEAPGCLAEVHTPKARFGSSPCAYEARECGATAARRDHLAPLWSLLSVWGGQQSLELVGGPDLL